MELPLLSSAEALPLEAEHSPDWVQGDLDLNVIDDLPEMIGWVKGRSCFPSEKRFRLSA
jgi:hypothetical protein